MRMTAPAIGVAAVVLALVLVWYFRPAPEPMPVSADAALPVQPSPVADASPAGIVETSAAPAPAPVAESGASSAPSVTRSPLPGETPSTPMANLQADLEVRPEVAEGERRFAAEPVDATWAPGAEADLLARFAQMPGLQLIDLQVECRSTMCRLQLTQPRGGPAVEGGPRPFSVLRDSVGLEPRWMMAIGDGSSTMKSVAYLWRQGFGPQQAAGQPHESD